MQKAISMPQPLRDRGPAGNQGKFDFPCQLDPMEPFKSVDESDMPVERTDVERGEIPGSLVTRPKMAENIVG